MPQFRTIPGWDNNDKKSEDESKEPASEEAPSSDVLSPAGAPENQASSTPEPLLLPSPITGHIPVLLLTGPHSTPDGEALTTLTSKTPTLSQPRISTGGNTNRLTVIPADPKLQRKKTTTSTALVVAPRPQSTRRPLLTPSRKLLLITGFLIVFLVGALVSKLYFLAGSQATSSGMAGIPCQTGCYTSLQPSSLTVQPMQPTAGNATPLSTVYPAPTSIAPAWKLTFDEEFNETGLNWNIWEDGGQNWGSGGNGEEQAYLASECSISNGLLYLRAEDSPASGKQYSSCMLNTMHTFRQTYGYFEFRGKLPQGQGFWPAFWLYESSMNGKPEIDVMENLGSDMRTYYMTYHSDAGTPQKTYHGVDLSAGFHTYAVKWMPDSITYYFDNKAQFTVTDDVYNSAMFILINLAVGGNWPGSPDASTPFPSYMEVDYVRVYAMP